MKGSSDVDANDGTVTGGEIVVDMLVSLGVRHMFGVVGGQTLAITDAIIDNPNIEFIHTRHEGAAAVMADAYGRLSGRPAACIATTGPGVTNLLTGVGGALRDSSPALVLTCNNNGENIHKDDAQNADHVELLKPLTKFSRLVAHGSSIVQALEEAYINAVTGNPGPAHLDFARDTIEGRVAASPAVPTRHPSLSWVAARPQPSDEAMRVVVEKVMRAERPVLWIGNGVMRARASEEVLRLAELANIPVVTTFNGIGSVPTVHPLVFGPVSRMGTWLSTRVLEDSDLVIAIGNSLNAVSTTRWKRQLADVVQVDIDPAMIGRYYASVTHGVVSDAAAFARRLHGLLSELGVNGDSRSDWIEELSVTRETWWEMSAIPDDQSAPQSGTDTISPAHLVRSLRTTTPDETLLIPDAGNPGVWSFLWDIRRVGTYIKPVGFGNMGFALPSAIAAVLLDPARPVLALIGDGSLGMSLGELETLARVGGPVAVVVMNDQSYGNIRQEQVLHFDGRTIGVDFGHVNFGEVARAMGVRGVRTSELATVSELVGEAFRDGVPVVIDVPIDRDVNAWTYSAFAPWTKEVSLAGEAVD